MKWRVLVEVTGGDGVVTQHMISDGERTEAGQAETLGLSLAEGKATLAAVQRVLVTAQTDAHCRHRRRCSHCGAARPLKDYRPRRLVSLFGAVEVRAPRFEPCRCGVACRRTLTDLDALVEAADNRQARKVVTLLHALQTYVVGQGEVIIDYAAARRRGEPISTATTENTVQRLLHRRMGANQQMRWSPRGAHQMLKVRSAVMNGTLAADHAVAEPYARRPFRRAA